jgi:hypothetical protein
VSRRWLVLLALGLAGPAAAGGLGDVPFWRGSLGCWTSENSYFNPQMDYNLKSYASILCVRIEGDTMQETEIKYYPASAMASGYAGGLLRAGEGVEVVNMAEGRREDEVGRVRLTRSVPVFGQSAETTEIVPLSDDTAMRQTRVAGEAHDNYRMIVTLPAPDRRYRLNLGLVSAPGGEAVAGDLRGFSIFRERRIAEAEVAGLRAALRQRFAVGVVVRADSEGAPMRVRVEADGAP